MSISNLHKVLLTLALLMSANLVLCAQALTAYVADSYVGTLCVTIDGTRYEHKDICMHVEKRTDGTLDFSIDDFKLARANDTKPLGNILLVGVTLSKQSDSFLVKVASSQTFTIANGTSFSTIEVDKGKTDNVIGGGSSSGNTSETYDDPNTAGGDDQKAEGAWGNDDDSDDSGNSGLNGGSHPSEPEWYGPVYGTMSVDVSGCIFKEYADLSFDVYIPSLMKSVNVTFHSGNVPTRIAAVKSVAKCCNGTYTITGILASPSSCKGIVIGNGKKRVLQSRH